MLALFNIYVVRRSAGTGGNANRETNTAEIPGDISGARRETTSSASIHQEPRYCDAFSKSVGKNRDDRGETTLIIEGIVEGINQS